MHSFMLGFLLDPNAATPRTVTLAANNGCSGAGQGTGLGSPTPTAA
jgi:hypothetical protein